MRESIVSAVGLHCYREGLSLRNGMSLVTRLVAMVLLAFVSGHANAQTFTTLLSFSGTSGAYPGANPNPGLVLIGSNLYGTTNYGGAYNDGTVFSLPVSGGSATILTSFNGNNGFNSSAGLTLSGSTFYGTTGEGGGSNDGTVFSLPVNGGTPTVLGSFNGSNGRYPDTRLTLIGSTLYGATEYGGPNNDGAVFSVPVNGGTPTVLGSFNGSNGEYPQGDLTLIGSTIYGTAYFGGTCSWGTVFSLPVSGGTPTVLTSFDGGAAVNAAYPACTLTLIGSTLYGTADSGGAYDSGTLFSLPVSGGTPTTLLSFSGTGGKYPGGDPQSNLILIGSTFYGTTVMGGAYNLGTVFEVNIDGSGYEDLFDFDVSDGRHPRGLILSGSTLYGTTPQAGPNGYGTVYSLTISRQTPEPSSLALLGVGAMGLIAYVWRRRRANSVVRFVLAAALLACAVSAQADVFNMGGTQNANGTRNGLASLQFVTVGDPGNAGNPSTSSLLGAVGYTYRMGKYDVTVGQYCQFLNAVATQSDLYGLYNSRMATTFSTFGIAQSGSPGNYSYSVTGSDSQGVNCPIFDVSWGDASRFCNWLQNGQPSGAEGPGTTENGSYTLNGTGTNLMAVTRNPGATYVIPSVTEWYKAAYYVGGGINAGYWFFPTQSSTTPSNELSATGRNNANFAFNGGYTDPTNYLTPVGAFVDSPGPYGTYDMGGDVWQWDEGSYSGEYRGLYGGAYNYPSYYMGSPYAQAIGPGAEYGYIGFRVASVPEPTSTALFLASAVALGIWRLRRKACESGA